MLAELDLGGMQTNREWPWDGCVSNLVCFCFTGREGGDGKHTAPVSLYVWVRLGDGEAWNDDDRGGGGWRVGGKVTPTCF